MKKFLLAAMILTAGFLAAAIPSQGESALPGSPVGKYRCLNCGVVVQSEYDSSIGKIPEPSKKGCKKSSNGEHKWWAMGAKVR